MMKQQCPRWLTPRRSSLDDEIVLFFLKVGHVPLHVDSKSYSSINLSALPFEGSCTYRIVEDTPYVAAVL